MTFFRVESVWAAECFTIIELLLWVSEGVPLPGCH